MRPKVVNEDKTRAMIYVVNRMEHNPNQINFKFYFMTMSIYRSYLL